jgi:superfamily II RNA helicase
VFYTTPLKALSNQKFSDFRRQFGAEKVGLLTGDSSFNREAPIAVMTTEVFRNMLYDSRAATATTAGTTTTTDITGPDELKDVFAVVFDEFHYMNDKDRGTVWEESVINCPRHVLLVALSATMANVGDIAGWLQQTHGPTELVTSDFRPVPLRYWFATNKGMLQLFKDSESGPGAKYGAKPTRSELAALQAKNSSRSKRGRVSATLPERLQINTELLKMHEEEMYRRRSAETGNAGSFSSSNSRGERDRQGRFKRSSGSSSSSSGGGRQRPSQKYTTQREVPSYQYLVRCLARQDLLPAIVFIFSRMGCEQAAKEIGNSSNGALLTEAESALVQDKIAAFRTANPQVRVKRSCVLCMNLCTFTLCRP